MSSGLRAARRTACSPRDRRPVGRDRWHRDLRRDPARAGAVHGGRPHGFYTAVGPFGVFNGHYIRDVASFYGAIGIGLRCRHRALSWRVPVLARDDDPVRAAQPQPSARHRQGPSAVGRATSTSSRSPPRPCCWPGCVAPRPQRCDRRLRRRGDHEGVRRGRHRRDRPPAAAGAAGRRARADRDDALEEKADALARTGDRGGRVRRIRRAEADPRSSPTRAPSRSCICSPTCPKTSTCAASSARLASTGRLRSEGTRNLIAAARAAGVRADRGREHRVHLRARREIASRTRTRRWPARRCRSPPSRSPTSSARCSTPAASCCATASSTAPAPGSGATARGPPTCAAGACRSSATGSGVFSFLHVDDAASATVAALARERARRPTTSSTTSPRRSTTGCPCTRARSERPSRGACPTWVAPPGGRAACGRDDERAARREQRAHQARARLAPRYAELARGLSDGARLSARRLGFTRRTQPSSRRTGRSEQHRGPGGSACSHARSRARRGAPRQQRPRLDGSDRTTRSIDRDACPVITTAVSPLAPSVRTGDERDRHVHRAEQPADERPPRRPADVCRDCRVPPSHERDDQQQRDGADQERDARRLHAADAPAQARVDRRLHADQAAGADAQQRRKPRHAARSLRLQPVRPDADVHRQRRLARSHTPTISRSISSRAASGLAGRPFEQQLVVDRQQQPRVERSTARARRGSGPSRA